MGVSSVDVRAAINQPSMFRLAQRKVFNFAGWGLCALTFLMLGGAMVWILQMVFVRGAGSMTWKVLSTVTVGVGGGLLNAIEGTLLLAIGGVILSVPPGIAAGIYMSEYDGGGRGPGCRFLSEGLGGVSLLLGG